MIVSMPQIAVSAPAVKAPVNAANVPEPFSTALSQATGNHQDPSSSARVISHVGNRQHSSTDPKGNAKSSAKAPAASDKSTPGTQPPAVATLGDHNVVKAVSNPPLPISLSALVGPAAADTNVTNSSLSSESSAKSEAASVASAFAAGPDTLSPAGSLQALDQAGTGSTSLLTKAAKAISPNASKVGTPQPAASSEDNAKTKAASDRAKLDEGEKASAAAQDSKSRSVRSESAIPIETKLPPAEPKPASHENIPSGSSGDAKNSSVEHRGTVADAAPLPAVPAPTIPVTNLKSSSGSDSSSANNTAAKVNPNAVSSSSATSKKDGNAAQNSSSQSKKNDAAVSLAGASVKSASNNAHAQSAGNTDSTFAAAAQISQPVGDAKTPPPAIAAKADSTAKDLGQMPSAAHEVQSAAETAQFASPLQIAKLVERAGQTELRVGIQAGEFGSVDIRTSMAHSQFTAEISVERGELGRAMSVELPALHARLAEQRVPPANIVVQDHSYSSGGSSDLRQGTRQQQYTAPNQNLAGSETDFNPAIIAMEAMDSSAGLDIHI